MRRNGEEKKLRCYKPTQMCLNILGIWGLVNNAGIATVAPIEWMPLDHIKRVADVNLWGLIDVTKTFLPLIKKSQGRIVNLSSLAGKAD